MNENTDTDAARNPQVSTNQSQEGSTVELLVRVVFCPVFFLQQFEYQFLHEASQQTINKLISASLILPTSCYITIFHAGSVIEKILLSCCLLAQLALLHFVILKEFRTSFASTIGDEENTGSSDNAKKGVSELAKEKWVTFVPLKPGETISVGGEEVTTQDEVHNEEASKVENCVVEDERDYCSICLCGYAEGEFAVRLPCSHVFHKDCISVWTINEIRCPLCNFDLV